MRLRVCPVGPSAAGWVASWWAVAAVAPPVGRVSFAGGVLQLLCSCARSAGVVRVGVLVAPIVGEVAEWRETPVAKVGVGSRRCVAHS